MLSDGYLTVNVDRRRAYVRRDAIPSIKEVSTLIFDCDGVLIDARNSYNRSISRTVSYLAQNLLKIPLPEQAISEQVIYSFRKSGGFNNDWDATCAILLYLYTKLPKQALNSIQALARSKDRGNRLTGDAFERISEINRRLKSVDPLSIDVEAVEEDLLMLAEKADSRGLVSVEEALSKALSTDALKSFSWLMSHPAAVGVSLVTTVFEELFLGPDLFRRKYGLQPHFITEGVGLVADERPVVSEETLQLLTERFGKLGLGIVSGRSQLTAEYTLGTRLKCFNSDLVVFVEDDISTALKNGELAQAKDFGKPSPYGLLKAEKATSKSGLILYIGDSKEDLLMVERANQVSNRFITGGVYGCATSAKDLIDLFMDNDVYLVAESVNDLYRLFKMIGEGEVR
ncbi:MAG: hypothetical protein M1503_06105 [Thaumarchaeota archaeon]|nr:hypothetical protein [Nitrososphaerota archaeon]MCL5317816.1 hypothetical protein [Nitrososphaerota archaeon]